jgi:hypothetical protein
MDMKHPFSGTVKEYTMETYKCDAKGKKTLEFKYVWQYNEYNNISEVKHYNAKNKLADVSSYVIYDHKTHGNQRKNSRGTSNSVWYMSTARSSGADIGPVQRIKHRYQT